MIIWELIKEGFQKSIAFWLYCEVKWSCHPHLCDIKASLPIDGGSTSDDDEEHGADQLGNQGSCQVAPAVWHQWVRGDHLWNSGAYFWKDWNFYCSSSTTSVVVLLQCQLQLQSTTAIKLKSQYQYQCNSRSSSSNTNHHMTKCIKIPRRWQGPLTQ